MGNPLFKPSDGDRFKILRVGEEITYSGDQAGVWNGSAYWTKGVSGRLTDSAAWQEVAPYSSRRHPRRLSERVTRVRFGPAGRFADQIFVR